MNSMRNAKLALGVICTAMIFAAVRPASIDAIPAAPVVVLGNIPGSIEAAAQYARQGLQYVQQVQQYQRQVEELTAVARRLGNVNDMNSFQNAVVSLNNNLPTSAGNELAQLIVSAGNGGPNPAGLVTQQTIADCQRLSNEADGNRQEQAASVDCGLISPAAQLQIGTLNALQMTAANADQQAARVTMSHELDLTDSYITLQGSGFRVAGIHDYSLVNHIELL